MMDRKHRAVWMSEKYWRKSRLAHSFALLSVVALAATGTFAVEDAAKLAGVGLSGVFPATPPADLSDDEFAKLNGNWAEWSKGAAAAVADFYSKIESSDPAAQRASLGVLKVKLDVMRRALDDPRYLSLHGPLTALHNSLSMRIDFAEAALDTLEIDGAQVAGGKLKSRSSELLTAISSLEGYLSTIKNGTLWLPYFKVDALKTALSGDSQGAAAITAASESLAALQTRGYVLDAEQKEFTHRPAFESYSNAVSRFAAAAAWTNAPEALKNLRTELKTLSDSLDNYSATGERADELRHAFSRVRFLSADGGDRLASSLQKRLFNYNLRVLVTEEFLNKLMSQTRRETGPVSDYILEARVSGQQITDTTVTANLKPSNNSARFDLQLQGNIRSNTQGVTSQATVQTAGNHTFIATKEINFDGLVFSTKPATISVNPHNTTTGITTNLTGVPILGRIANGVASQQIEARSGEVQAIAASRVRDGVLPRFNKEVDASFATEGDKLNRETFAGLRSTGLFPDSYSYQTTDRLLTVSARVMSDSQIAADVPEASLLTVTGATGLFHESIMNNAIDQIGIAGQTLTEPELRAKMESFLSKVMNKPFKFDAPPPAEPGSDEDEKGVNGIIFAPTDPIRVRIQDNVLTLIIRAGFKQEGKDDIPMREVTVPISFVVQGQKIAIQRGNVKVAAAEGEGGGISVNAVVRKKIQSVMPDRLVDGKIEFKGPEKTVVAYVTKIRLVDGWAAVSVD